jgi:hypothetical protein
LVCGVFSVVVLLSLISPLDKEWTMGLRPFLNPKVWRATLGLFLRDKSVAAAENQENRKRSSIFTVRLSYILPSHGIMLNNFHDSLKPFVFLVSAIGVFLVFVSFTGNDFLHHTVNNSEIRLYKIASELEVNVLSCSVSSVTWITRCHNLRFRKVMFNCETLSKRVQSHRKTVRTKPPFKNVWMLMYRYNPGHGICSVSLKQTEVLRD